MRDDQSNTDDLPIQEREDRYGKGVTRLPAGDLAAKQYDFPNLRVRCREHGEWNCPREDEHEEKTVDRLAYVRRTTEASMLAELTAQFKAGKGVASPKPGSKK